MLDASITNVKETGMTWTKTVDGSIVDESQNIVAWAEANPAGGYPI